MFECKLLNQPFGDPALYVRLANEKKALLFDLGDISGLSPGELIKVTHVFVSHTHMDHFIGFDHLVRLNLSRDKTLHLFGPEGIIENVKGKLNGYTWDLVAGYPFIVEVTEIGAVTLRNVRFICNQKFEQKTIDERPFKLEIDANPYYTVKAKALDHRIFSLAFSIEERFHININKDKLMKLGFPCGKWLNDFKDAVWRDEPDDFMISVTEKTAGCRVIEELPLSKLKNEIATIKKGQKIVYVSDCRGTESNFKKIISFTENADLLFCEASFLDRDREKASERGHLTAKQAGFIARESGVKELRVFHFSPRYESIPDKLYQEAEQEFKK
jgi:ribonuclease Z